MSVNLHYEDKARSAGFSSVCGVDEAGAGPLMGPVYAAAVILPEGCEIEGLNDSKKMTEKKREALFPVICEKAVAYAIASVDEKEIDATDILSARMKAMQLGHRCAANPSGLCAHRRQPRPRRVGKDHHAARDHRRRGRRELIHRRGERAGEGQP